MKTNRRFGLFGKKLSAIFVVGILLSATLLPATQAAAANDFSLQVTPSPLVATVRPGQPTQLELKIRNAGTATEELKIEPRSFTIESGNEKVKLSDTTPPDIAQWISFSSPTFTVQPGQWFTQKVHVALPKDAGFSYSFALLISRKNNPAPTNGGRLIKGSVAVFTLVNVDRPGATRKLEATGFKTSRGVYEYLPTSLSVRFKNTGNTIVQPYGNIFIQRGSNDKNPISTLPVNETRGYILPGSVRTLETSWDKGFPLYKTSASTDGTQRRSSVWDWSKISDFRIGRYTAKLVAVYNDGVRDVPIQSEVIFWVFPWKILLGLLVVLLLVLFGLWSLVRKIIRLFQRPKSRPTPET